MIADGRTPMRLCARGPSGTLTASTPAFLSARHCSSIGAGSTPLGGTISTLVTSSPRASFDHPPRVAGHVLGRGEIDLAVPDVARQAGVGLSGDGPVGRLAHLFHRLEYARRPDGAVHADHVGAPLGEA